MSKPAHFVKKHPWEAAGIAAAAATGGAGLAGMGPLAGLLGGAGAAAGGAAAADTAAASLGSAAIAGVPASAEASLYGVGAASAPETALGGGGNPLLNYMSKFGASKGGTFAKNLALQQGARTVFAPPPPPPDMGGAPGYNGPAPTNTILHPQQQAQAAPGAGGIPGGIPPEVLRDPRLLQQWLQQQGGMA